jgi:restriction endonuclease S subunit
VLPAELLKSWQITLRRYRFLFHFVQSDNFVRSLSSLIQGALYPAATDKQVFSLLFPWVPIEEQRQIAALLKAQLAEVDKVRHEAEAQLREINTLPQNSWPRPLKALSHERRQGQALGVGHRREF